MRSIFSSLHARAICHSTEDLDKVKVALANAVGASEIHISETEGHHGNPIKILESTIDEAEDVETFLSRINERDTDVLLSSLSSRIDDSCHLFVRLDKQAAFGGRVEFAKNDDVISIRIKVQSYPSRCDIATAAVRDYFSARRVKGKQL